MVRPLGIGVQQQLQSTAVSFRGVGKRFGATVAVEAVSLDIAAGTVHAFVGENGAGKSTLLGMLAGRIALTEGEIEVFGQTLITGNVRSSRAAGVVAIYQELTIVPDLSACANVFLGQTRSRLGFLAEQSMRRRFKELCARLGVDIPAEVLAGRLSVANQQILEILRALQSDARILLLDEPTSALAPPEREALFQRIRELRANGVTVLLVSHNLDEVLAIADAVSVCRDGRLVRSAPTTKWTKSGLVAAMLGHAVAASEKRKSRRVGDLLLRVEKITVPGKIENISVAVSVGEIVGLGGLVGSGRTTALRALCGLEPNSSGRIWIDGKERRWPTSPAHALDLGLALIPEDRKQGLVLGMPAQENIVLADLNATARAGFVWKIACAHALKPPCAATSSIAGAFPHSPAHYPEAISRNCCLRAGAIVSPAYCWPTSRRAASMSVPKRRYSANCGNWPTQAWQYFSSRRSLKRSSP